MRKLIILKLTLILFTLNSAAQTKPKNQWFWQADLGYMPIWADGSNYISNMTVERDSVRSFSISKTMPETYIIAIPINVTAVYKKKSGWFYAFGFSAFLGTRFEYATIYAPRAEDMISTDGGYPTYLLDYFKYKQQIITVSAGIGYETTHLRYLNLFLGLNLLAGGGWATELSGRGPEFYNYKFLEFTFGDTFLKTFGATLYFGSDIPLNKTWSAIMKGNLNLTSMNSKSVIGTTSTHAYYSSHTPDTYNFPENSSARGNSVGGVFGFALNIGVRYKL